MKIEDKQKRELLMLGVAVLTVLLLLFGRNQISGKGGNGTTVVDNKPPQAVSEPAVAELVTPEPTENPENGVYSYLQGPKSWKERREWSGKGGRNTMTEVRLVRLGVDFVRWQIFILH